MENPTNHYIRCNRVENKNAVGLSLLKMFQNNLKYGERNSCRIVVWTDFN